VFELLTTGAAHFNVVQGFHTFMAQAKGGHVEIGMDGETHRQFIKTNFSTATHPAQSWKHDRQPDWDVFRLLGAGCDRKQ
jgi:hypothetical protein